MTEKKTDTRPEGSVLLRAAMMGEWKKALCIADHAIADGCRFNITVTQHPNMRGVPLQVFQFGEGL